MGKDLIIVESPAKIKTIKKFLGGGYEVEASVGHVRDLPTKTLGVDEDNDFAPDYQIIPGKAKVVSKLKSAAKAADTVYLAPDPDREGEAIAWHVAEIIRTANPNVKRIQFNEITAKAVKEALANPTELRKPLFDSQQARRILDRLVGYKISPLLWKKVKRGLSAGRVQSVALRLIVDRERERQAFISEEYWLFKITVQGETPPPFDADLWKVDGEKPVIGDEKTALALESRVSGLPYVVQNIVEKERQRHPRPPFITSTLQQDASNKLGFNAKRTMSVAQRLYEGVELGERGTTALITYMRTDSVRISDEARDGAREWIISTLGPEFYPAEARVYKSKGSAQDAHEAIRPVDPSLTPDSIKNNLPPEQYKLYKLIWERFMASQMASARFWDTVATIESGPVLWRAKGERLVFPGFLRIWPQSSDSQSALLPKLVAGQELSLEKLHKEQKFTQPPARFSEASLVHKLEELGIGRPSTYAAIISTLTERDYVHIEEKHFQPTDLGVIVCDLLVEHFAHLMDAGFTARMEESLDHVAEGESDWVALLRDFTLDFNPTLDKARENMTQVKAGMDTGLSCPQCEDGRLVVKFGKNGTFLGCANYPACSFTSNYIRNSAGEIELVKEEAPEELGPCPKCEDGRLVVKKTKTGGRFVACSNYPACRHTKSVSTHVACPKDGCDGELVEKTSRRGKPFYSCSKYPKCDYAVWDFPVAKPCPLCESKILVRKETKARGVHLACPVKDCGYWEKED
ncbi:type I DNA topoisomerase [Desulfomicrobium macestii]|uniref:type I DNA topoisomerase n=1 Tax=Desulfomicrobium macestii TaxID=90731 RepID=UPI00178AEE13|nr:type I DNA topoisomerase [Desulfomicrobium macestii]